MTQHYRENANLFPTYLMTGRYLPTIKSIPLTQTQTATQFDTGASKTEEAGTGDKMDVDSTPEDDLDKTPTKARQGMNESNAGIGNDGWPLQDEHIVTKGMLLVGGREEMEGEFADRRH